jgi:hypothetical protein
MLCYNSSGDTEKLYVTTRIKPLFQCMILRVRMFDEDTAYCSVWPSEYCRRLICRLFCDCPTAPSTTDLICTCLESEHTNTALEHNFSPQHRLSVFVQLITLFLLAPIARQAAA